MRWLLAGGHTERRPEGLERRVFLAVAPMKKYAFHLVLFVIALWIFLSVEYTLSDTDDYYYLFGAISLLKNHVYLVYGHPPTYPLGYPLLIVPFLWIFGVSVQSAVLPCAVLGALTVVLLFEFVKERSNTHAALFAAAFMLFSSHWAMSSVLMSDVPALFFMLLSIYAFVKYLETEKPMFIYLFYPALGVACLIKYVSFMVVIILGLHMILSGKMHFLRKKELWFGLPIFLLVLLPQLIYNSIYFKSPFQTGYSALHQQSYEGLKLFSFKYFYTAGYRRPAFQIITYLKYLIAGFGTPILPFCLYGLWSWMRKKQFKKVSLILVWIAVPVVIMSFYFGPLMRYINLSSPALFLLAGQGFSALLDVPILKNKTIRKAMVYCLALALLLPTAVFWHDIIQKRATNRRCQQQTFAWIGQNSDPQDVIISFKESSYEYHSGRQVYSFDSSIDELEQVVSLPGRSFFVVHETWRTQHFIEGLADAEEWLRQTHGLTHLKRFECKPEISWVSKIVHRVSDRMGVPSLPLLNVWNVYLIDSSQK